jgi:hypothetical protein
MTLPNEWFISMRNNREFLFELLNPGKTPRVSKEVRKRASECLKHFPMKHEIDEMEKMYENSHKDKGILIGETNQQLQRIAGEAMLVNAHLTKVSKSIQDIINQKENNNE